MHVADGVLSAELCVAAGLGVAAALYVTTRRARSEEVPRMGLMAAALFTASSLHFPIAGTSIHLGLAGLAGILLAWRSLPVVFAALLFQAVLLQHGGLLTLGVNTINIGSGALAAAALWHARPLPEFMRAFLAGAVGVLVPATLVAAELSLSGYGRGVFWLLGIYAAGALIEGALTVAIVAFFRRTQSSILEAGG